MAVCCNCGLGGSAHWRWRYFDASSSDDPGSSVPIEECKCW
jgi:hypothetical protein